MAVLMRIGWHAAIFLACLLLTVSSPPALAAGRFALVIGNSSYINAGKLPNSVNDANDIAAELRDLGFQVDLGLDLSYSGFSNLVADFRGKVKTAQATEVVFYYAGHGFQLHGLNHLVPVDAKLQVSNYLPYETLQLNQIIKSIRTSEVQTLIVLLDACRNNPLPPALRGSNSGDGLAQLQEVDGAYVVFATQPGNVSRDGLGRNGPFAAALLKYMDVTSLSISELMIDVRRDVREATQGSQVPWDLSTLSENFYFRPAMFSFDEETEPPAVKVPVAKDTPEANPNQAGPVAIGTPEAKPDPGGTAGLPPVDDTIIVGVQDPASTTLVAPETNSPVTVGTDVTDTEQTSEPKADPGENVSPVTVGKDLADTGQTPKPGADPAAGDSLNTSGFTELSEGEAPVDVIPGVDGTFESATRALQSPGRAPPDSKVDSGKASGKAERSSRPARKDKDAAKRTPRPDKPKKAIVPKARQDNRSDDKPAVRVVPKKPVVKKTRKPPEPPPPPAAQSAPILP